MYRGVFFRHPRHALMCQTRMTTHHKISPNEKGARESKDADVWEQNITRVE